MRHFQRATNWGAWPIGLLKAKMDVMGEEADNNITEIIEVCNTEAEKKVRVLGN